MRHYPMKLKPHISETIWGGTRLAEEYGVALAGHANCAEAWVLSAHHGGGSVVLNGAYAGQGLAEVWKKNPAWFSQTGEAAAFPILIKLIDAMDDLSVQVHPRDGDAVLKEGEAGKTECWYILDARPGAKLLLGFQERITREAFARAVRENTLTSLVREIEVKAGDFFFIPAGTLHAIGRGVLLAEVQQSSDTTYRVYDYGRLQGGKPRALHIEQALAVTELGPYNAQSETRNAQLLEGGARERTLVKCPLFTVREWELREAAFGIAGPESFVSLLVLEGAGTLSSCGEALPVKKGDSLLIPAGSGKYALEGKIRLLLTTI
ncbi:MAG: class I mannose-6-phosphate isomerase [Oscillospiraceae bacterium]|nr:class I mannose-6-phosphate isomerase [Oscillospiraceae bacterium]